MAEEPLSALLKELAETTDYLRETGRIMRRAIDRLIEHEGELEKVNRQLIAMSERTDRAIDAALRALDRGTDHSGS